LLHRLVIGFSSVAIGSIPAVSFLEHPEITSISNQHSTRRRRHDAGARPFAQAGGCGGWAWTAASAGALRSTSHRTTK
jgi:hypothetical protein